MKPASLASDASHFESDEIGIDCATLTHDDTVARWLAGKLFLGREKVAPVLLLGPLMKVRYLLCKAMIVLKMGNPNCNQSRLFRRVGD